MKTPRRLLQRDAERAKRRPTKRLTWCTPLGLWIAASRSVASCQSRRTDRIAERAKYVREPRRAREQQDDSETELTPCGPIKSGVESPRGQFCASSENGLIEFTVPVPISTENYEQRERE